MALNEAPLLLGDETFPHESRTCIPTLPTDDPLAGTKQGWHSPIPMIFTRPQRKNISVPKDGLYGHKAFRESRRDAPIIGGDGPLTHRKYCMRPLAQD